MKFSCKECCFIKKVGETQIGCSLGSLQKMKLRKEVVGKQDGIFQLSRGCPTKRNKVWESKQANRTASILKESIVDIYVIIYNEGKLNHDRLEEVVRAINAQKHQPTFVKLVVNKKDNFNYRETQYILQALKSPWDIQEQIYNGTMSEVTDHLVKKLSEEYVCIVDINDGLPDDIFQKINDNLYKKFNRVGLVKYKNSYVVNTTIWRFYLGNSPCPRNKIYGSKDSSIIEGIVNKIEKSPGEIKDELIWGYEQL